MGGRDDSETDYEIATSAGLEAGYKISTFYLLGVVNFKFLLLIFTKPVLNAISADWFVFLQKVIKFLARDDL